MNSLDIFFVVILVFFLFRGMLRGLVLEISSIAGLVAGFIAANRFYTDLEPLAARVIPDHQWSQAVAYLGIFITAMLMVVILSLFLKNFLRLIMLGWLDRLGGGLLGTVKAGVICGLGLMILTIFLPRDHELISTSKIAPHVHTMSQTLAGYLPQELKEKFREKADSAWSFLEDGWEELIKPERKDNHSPDI